ncbi:ABC transporter substrate-binding protein [Longimicrobium terrae]|uniref:Ribose transport system substrate-binding protein n=1 Tax=Longimicrobium terrae TaxID=1639882 RepID=A0A841GWG9_9BACT|nr:ABC transporter substrate-binding protein [Longimicrobium terrae]MBB4635769.1 ribose transport system substrate-binding protein [Longimicrobium terrae]MBB6070164.1 ribose transport system substrate-binding protein [Longimicrobium terrae]NNC33065.1 ABC transporter substrate-binding protein [Longimicrobium terrae]
MSPFRLRTFLRAGVLPVLALSALAGCRKEAASDGKWTVGFSQMGHDNPWRMAQTASLRDEAQKRGYDIVVTDAQDQTAKQVADVEDLIARRVNVILLAPREYEGLAPALQAAKEANIPVILVDREAEGKAGDDFVTFLGSNFVEQGRRAAEWLVKETGGTAGIVELTGTPGSSVASDRAKGFREVIAQHPGMKILASQTGEFSRATGQRVMQNIAQSLGPQITAVYAHNDEMALGAIQAVRAAGRTPGTDVRIVSIDGQRAALEAIQRGELGATVESNPRFGPIAFETIEQVRKGQQVPPKKLITDRFFDRTNAAQFVAEAY